MNEINFCGTFKIPLYQSGVKPAQRAELRKLVQSYPNSKISSNKSPSAKISIPDVEDEGFIAKLKEIGYETFQRFGGNNINKADLDKYITNATKNGAVENVAPKNELKEFAKKNFPYEKNLSQGELERRSQIMSTKDYKYIVDQCGEEAAKMLCFGLQAVGLK